MAKSESQQTEPLWSYVKLSQYAAPAGPATETAHQGLKFLWRRLRNFRGRSRLPDERSQVEPDSLSEEILDQVASPPAWTEAGVALGERLCGLSSSSRHGLNIQVVVGAPGSGTNQIATQWARSQGWPVVKPPTPGQVLANDDTWLDGVLKGLEPRAFLPQLERYFLRHPDGFGLIRKLLERVLNNSASYVIECNGWGWFYLSTALDISDHLPEPITLEAFDHLRLERWFWSLCSDAEDFVFRQVDNKRSVLTPMGIESEERDTEASDFLRRLAAYSRGNPGVAWAIWRHSLRGASDETAEEDHGRSTLWVQPWSQLDLPAMPGWADESDKFLLHALLVHGGLSAQVLQQILPMSLTDVMRGLYRLRAARLLQKDGETWCVSAIAYPAVRQHLTSEGFLVDAL